MLKWLYYFPIPYIDIYRNGFPCFVCFLIIMKAWFGFPSSFFMFTFTPRRLAMLVIFLLLNIGLICHAVAAAAINMPSFSYFHILRCHVSSFITIITYMVMPSPHYWATMERASAEQREDEPCSYYSCCWSVKKNNNKKKKAYMSSSLLLYDTTEREFSLTHMPLRASCPCPWVMREWNRKQWAGETRQTRKYAFSPFPSWRHLWHTIHAYALF